jgi:ORF6N domain
MRAKPIAEFVPQLRILTLRDQRVLLDADLARLYGVQTRALNQAVKRNLDRFPAEFAFPLTREEILSISQTVTSLSQLKFSKSVQAFTEHGALQAANVLNSAAAVQMSLYVIRAFVKMREELTANATILKRLAEIDKTLMEHDSALRDVYRKLLPLLQPPPESPRRRIGFNADQQ